MRKESIIDVREDESSGNQVKNIGLKAK